MAALCSPAACEACPGRVVCRCLQVTEEVVVDAINRLGLRTVSEIRNHTGAGDGCTCCHRKLLQYVEESA